MTEPLDLDEICRRWSRYGGTGKDRNVGRDTDAVMRTLVHWAVNDVPALIAEIQRLREARLAKIESALNELGDVRVYGERNSTYYCGAQTMANRVRAALTPEDGQL